MAAADNKADLLLPKHDAANIPRPVLSVLVAGRPVVQQPADEAA